MMRIAIALVALMLVVAVGGTAVVACINVSPPVQKIEQVVPDARFPQ